MRGRRRLAPRRRRVRPLGAASPRFRHLTVGCERADSWATDAHKWLNVPYDCGIVFCRHPESHGDAMAVAASYLQRAEGRSPSDWVPESSRRARGFAVWAARRFFFPPLAGPQRGRRELVDRCCDHAKPSPSFSARSLGSRSSTTSSSTRCSSASGTTTRRRARSSAASRPTAPAGSEERTGRAAPRCESLSRASGRPGTTSSAARRRSSTPPQLLRRLSASPRAPLPRRARNRD